MINNYFDNIPDELKELPQWVCAVQGRKIPLNPFSGRAASCSDPLTWGTFAEARSGVEEDDADNIGFVFNGNGYVGIDLDEGVWDECGDLTDYAQTIIDKFDSYTERSRSGRGIHILCEGKLPWSGRNNMHGVEAYHTGRYFIMTGHVVQEHFIIHERQEAIDWLLETYFPEMREAGNSKYGIKAYNPLWQKPLCGKIRLNPMYPGIGNGSRNLSLASVAGSMHTAGYPSSLIRKELAKVNRVACDEPLDVWEIDQIIRSITRYKR